MNKMLITAITLAISLPVQAQMSPIGNWKSIDDQTQKPRSVVSISASPDGLSGRILERLDPDAKADDICSKCPDDRKDQLIKGLEIIRGVSLEADGDGRWSGGHILDPESGDEYKVHLTPIEGGKRLEVRGYVGFALFGRTQVWVRAE